VYACADAQGREHPALTLAFANQTLLTNEAYPMMEKIPTQTGARDQLMRDLKNVIQDAEAWLRSGSQLTGEDLKAAKAKLERTLTNAKDDLIRFEEAVVEKTKVAAQATDEYVKENPWKAIGIGAAVGVVLGLLISRR
jgi:ElaB/YqjD/DUF883 family membrane-anchored ribosome-binding protein